jgi:glutamate-1-semialdehyde 2,1-aminomutase
MVSGEGAKITDADGREYTDFLLSYGSCILGHNHPAIAAALREQIDRGTMFGTCNTAEVELAEQICKMVPCAELVRYANSGSEAMCGAVRAARGYTGKAKILKFEGHYHGWVDVLAVSNRPSAAEFGPLSSPASRPHSLGLPAGVSEDVVIAPWNEPRILTEILNRHEGEFAAVVCEPIVANNACILPRPGYLEHLREECSRRGIVLIFDEIVTGFRIARGGAQEFYGITPDLAVFSKALGGGLPIAAFCGRRTVMEPIGRNTVKHGGTYNGNPLCAGAALATLRELDKPGAIDRITASGQAIAEALRRAARDRGIPCIVQGQGGMLQIVFTTDAAPPHHYRDLLRADMKCFAALCQGLLDEGIHINSSGLACWFISTAHSDQDIAAAVQAIEHAMKAVA